jgi:hypothetical protein
MAARTHAPPVVKGGVHTCDQLKSGWSGTVPNGRRSSPNGAGVSAGHELEAVATRRAVASADGQR